jgi:uncharacterized protein (TIGR03435 family)
MTFLANHLWQSTWFAIAAAVLTVAFRRNRAAMRYALWLAASLKFLLPVSLLVVAVGHFASPRQAPVLQRIPALPVVTQISQPFVLPAGPSPAVPSRWPTVLLCVWFCGFAVNVVRWQRQWSRVRAAVRTALPLPIDAPIPVMAASADLEPGVFGIRRPVLLFPEGLVESLAPRQLDAILTHEMSHVRRRDNLAAAFHMLVEALFWFHPLVWWIGTRLMDERERACDEEVLRSCPDPESYADGILRVCRSSMGSPLACMSGVTGADLTRRIEGILTHRPMYRLSAAKKALLCAAAFACAAATVMISRAQSDPDQSAAFAVVSIKPDPNQRPPFHLGMELLPGGRVHGQLPLAFLIAVAYDLPMNSPRIAGLPDWSLSPSYLIDAAPEPGAVPFGLTIKALHARVRPMLQAMLADRFKLEIRRETRELPVYAITLRKGALKLEKAGVEEQDCTADNHTDCHNLHGGPGGWKGSAVSMDDVALLVSSWTDRPVIDRTGLTGLYKFDANWGPIVVMPGGGGGRNPADEGVDADAPTIMTVFNRLGLNLESARAPIDTYIVEHVERPTAN